MMTQLTACHAQTLNLDKYKLGVQSGFAKIPEALQIEACFGEADHFISSPDKHGNCTWNTEVYFGARYCLTMQVEVKMKDDFSEILKVVSSPQFYIIMRRVRSSIMVTIFMGRDLGTTEK